MIISLFKAYFVSLFFNNNAIITKSEDLSQRQESFTTVFNTTTCDTGRKPMCLT